MRSLLRFHVIASLPRSGSTLLCNILNQNPACHASDTSPLGMTFAAVMPALVHRAEFTSMLGHDGEMARAQASGALRGLIHGFYEPRAREVVFDKDRSNAWLFQADALLRVSPSSKIICLVRDPRDVVASAIANQAKEPLFRDSAAPNARTLLSRVNALASPQGLVGSAITAVEDAIMRSRVVTIGGVAHTDNIVLIKYEELTTDPTRVLAAIYEAINEPPFAHDFQHVVNVAGDKDFLYRDLWPHEGHGAVTPRRPLWPHHLPPGLAQSILKPYSVFCDVLGYR